MNIGRTARRWALVVIGLLLLGFGVACFNYTKPGSLEGHQEWAAAHGRPAPTETIFWGGAVSVAAGAFVVGFGMRGRIHLPAAGT